MSCIKRCLLALIIIGLIASCEEKSDEIKQIEKKAITAQIESFSFVDSISLELNVDKKWKVVDEMMVFIKKMEKDVNDYAKSNKNYTDLGKKLKENITLLTSNCTMSGMAHDQLHLWLVPFINTVEEFNASKNNNEAEVQFKHLQAFFKKFNLFFE